MTISELKRTLNFVQQRVIESNVPSRFNELIQILQQNAQRHPPHQPQPPLQPITNQKANLIAAVKAIRIQELTLNERRLLKTFVDTDVMGDKGVDKINQIFAEHNLDPMGAINAFLEIKSKYDKLIESAKEINRVLKPIDAAALETEIEKGHAVLQITFKERASIRNVTEWRESSDEWWQIIRSVGLLTDTTTDQAKVLSFELGSVIVEVMAAYIVVKTVGFIAEKALSVIERVLDLRKKVLEIKQLNLTNKQIELDLEREAATFQETKTAEIVEQVIGAIKNRETVNGEVQTAMKMAVEKVFAFLDKGGTVDCRFQQMDNEPDEAKKLRDVYGRIRTLETHVEQLKLIAGAASNPS